MDYMPEMHRKNSHNMRTSWKQIIRSKAQPQVKFNQIMAKSKLFNDNSAHYGNFLFLGNKNREDVCNGFRTFNKR